MAHDILDTILGTSKVKTGLQQVLHFVGKHGLATCRADGKCVVGTTGGVAYVGALKGATELMEKSMKGDKQAKSYIAHMKKRADAGDPMARGTMGVLDLAAMALKDPDLPEQYTGDFATQFSPGFESQDWAENRGEQAEVEFGLTNQNMPSQYVTYGAGKKPYAKIKYKGKMMTFATKAQYDAWKKKTSGTKRTSGSPYASQSQVQSALTRVPAGQRQALVSRIQQQQLVNGQQGYGQPIYPGQPGYPWPVGSANYGQPYYAPGAQGYAQGYGPTGYNQPSGMYGVASSTYGGPGMYATQDFQDDGTFQEEPTPGDVQFSDEGADSTEQAPSDMGD